MNLDRPIFIVGPHRSGTTLLYEMLSEHPELGYFNIANRRFPDLPFFAHTMTRLGTPDKPMEAQKIWDRFWHCEDDRMGAEDATPEAIAWYRKTASRVLRLRNASRFLAKYPRLSLRVGWIDTVFPGTLFVHIVRDWRAVVSSTLAGRRKRESKGGGWYGARIPGWKEMGSLPPEIVAGRQYRYLTQYLEKKSTDYPGRFFTIRYGRLCDDTVTTIRSIIDGCDLSWPESFVKNIRTDLQSRNDKWRSSVDPAMIEAIRSEDTAFFVRHEEPE